MGSKPASETAGQFWQWYPSNRVSRASCDTCSKWFGKEVLGHGAAECPIQFPTVAGSDPARLVAVLLAARDLTPEAASRQPGKLSAVMRDAVSLGVKEAGEAFRLAKAEWAGARGTEMVWTEGKLRPVEGEGDVVAAHDVAEEEEPGEVSSRSDQRRRREKTTRAAKLHLLLSLLANVHHLLSLLANVHLLLSLVVSVHLLLNALYRPSFMYPRNNTKFWK